MFVWMMSGSPMSRSWLQGTRYPRWGHCGPLSFTLVLLSNIRGSALSWTPPSVNYPFFFFVALFFFSFHRCSLYANCVAAFSRTSSKNDFCVCLLFIARTGGIQSRQSNWPDLCAMTLACSRFPSPCFAARCNSVLMRNTICATFPAASCFCTALPSGAQSLVAVGWTLSVRRICRKMASARYTCQISSLVYALYLVMRLCKRTTALLRGLGIYVSYLLVLSFELYLCSLAGISYCRQKANTFLAES